MMVKEKTRKMEFLTKQKKRGSPGPRKASSMGSNSIDFG